MIVCVWSFSLLHFPGESGSFHEPYKRQSVTVENRTENRKHLWCPSTPNFMGIWPIVVGNILIWTKLSDRWMNTHTSRSTGPTQWYLLICLKNNSVCSSICPAKNGRELKKGYRVDNVTYYIYLFTNSRYLFFTLFPF